MELDPNNRGIHAYPSTDDVTIGGGSFTQDVLDTIRVAREKYASSGIAGAYVLAPNAHHEQPQVCAVGAIIYADNQADSYLSMKRQSGPKESIKAFIERKLSDRAKAAMKALDATTLKYYSRSSTWARHSYTGAFEYLNERPLECLPPLRSPLDSDTFGSELRKAAVLGIFDETISALNSGRLEVKSEPEEVREVREVIRPAVIEATYR